VSTCSISSDRKLSGDAWLALISLFIMNTVQCRFCSSVVFHALQMTKGQNPLYQFPCSKSTQVGDFPVASPQHKRQVHNKLAQAKVCCVVLFPKFHYNDLLPTCCGLVGGRVTNKSAASWQLPRLWGKLRGNVRNGFWAYINVVVFSSLLHQAHDPVPLFCCI